MKSLPALHSVRVFDSAARLGSFKLAATELHLTPTAVSHQIRNLEHWLGLPLFIRETRKVKLTAEGQLLAQATTDSLRRLQHAIDELRHAAQQLTVHCTSSFAALWLLPRLADFQAKYPSLNVQIRSGEQIESQALSNQMAIRFGQPDLHEQAIALSTETFNLYGRPPRQHQLRGAGRCTVYMTRWKNPNLPGPPWRQWLKQHPDWAEQLEVRYFDQEMYGIQQALAGECLVFCGQTLVSQACQQGLLKPLGRNPAASPLGYYLSNGDNFSSTHYGLMRDWLLTQMRDVQDLGRLRP